MANTYTQIYIHLVFAVGRRECLIKENSTEEYLHILVYINLATNI